MKRPVVALAYISALLVLALLLLEGCSGGPGGGYGAPLILTPTPTHPLSSGLPSDVPIYPGAQLVGNPSANQAAFQVAADQETVKRFYQQQMPQQGWQAGQAQDNGADGIFLTFTKDTRTIHVTISPGNAANESTLIITLGNG